MLGEHEGASRLACTKGHSGHPSWASGRPQGLGRAREGPQGANRLKDSTLRIRHCGRLSLKPPKPRLSASLTRPHTQGQVMTEAEETGWGGTGDPLEGSRDTGQRLSQDATTFPNLRSIYMSGAGPRGPRWVGPVQNRGEGKYPCAPCILLPPRGAQRPAQGLPEGREEVQHAWAGARLQPRLCVQERRGRDAQVARLSAGSPDTRIWELLLLRMESWVPPFTPLLAREGCRCLKSTAK